MADEKIMPENGLEVRYERYKGIIKNFTLMSDIFIHKKKQPAADNDKILISVKEACELTGLSEKTMRTLMNNNTFMVRIGRRTLIDKKKFQKWIDRQS